MPIVPSITVVLKVFVGFALLFVMLEKYLVILLIWLAVVLVLLQAREKGVKPAGAKEEDVCNFLPI